MVPGMCRFFPVLRACVFQQLQGGLSMRLQRTNSPHIDVAHVALAKIDPNYIAVNCIVVFYLNSGPICRISAQESQICKKQNDVRFAIAHQIKSRRAI